MMAQIVVAKELNGTYRAMSSGLYNHSIHTFVTTFIGEVRVRECDRLNFFYVEALTTQEIGESIAGSGLVRYVEDGQCAVSLSGAL